MEWLEFSLFNNKVKVDSRLKEIFNNVAEKAKEKVSKYMGIAKSELEKYTLNFEESVANLPEIYEVGIRRIGYYFVPYVRKIGKVLGMVVPYAKKIFIDYSNLLYRNRLVKTIIHELVHVGQIIRGVKYKSRYQIEKEAERITNEIISSFGY